MTDSGKRMTLDEWTEFARRDDCLDKMVPSDLREALNTATRAERAACLKIAVEYGGRDAEEIAELIGQRSFNN